MPVFKVHIVMDNIHL